VFQHFLEELDYQLYKKSKKNAWMIIQTLQNSYWTNSMSQESSQLCMEEKFLFLKRYQIYLTMSFCNFFDPTLTLFYRLLDKNQSPLNLTDPFPKFWKATKISFLGVHWAKVRKNLKRMLLSEFWPLIKSTSSVRC